MNVPDNIKQSIEENNTKKNDETFISIYGKEHCGMCSVSLKRAKMSKDNAVILNSICRRCEEERSQAWQRDIIQRARVETYGESMSASIISYNGKTCN